MEQKDNEQCRSQRIFVDAPRGDNSPRRQTPEEKTPRGDNPPRRPPPRGDNPPRRQPPEETTPRGDNPPRRHRTKSGEGYAVSGTQSGYTNPWFGPTWKFLGLLFYALVRVHRLVVITVSSLTQIDMTITAPAGVTLSRTNLW